jgi:tRNA-dependent cyclodipeptide synthase
MREEKLVEKRAKVKASFVRAGHLKDQFKEAKCALPISVGQPYHEGEKFKATIELLNKHFKECMIIVCDSLQRHTMAIYDETASEEELHQRAIHEGDQWIERNIEIIKQLRIPYQIKRWDDWLNRPSYHSYKTELDNLYLLDKNFQLIANKTAEFFLSRFLKKQSGSNNVNRISQLSLEYLKEEAAIIPLWTEEKIDFELYPAKRVETMTFSYSHFILPYHKSLLQYVQLNLRSRE